MKLQKEGEFMKFPKPFMNTKELKEMGFTKTELLQYAHRPGQNYASRPTGSKGQFKFDTELFGNYLMEERRTS